MKKPMWSSSVGLALVLAAPLAAQKEPPLTQDQQRFRPITSMRFATVAQADFLKKDDRVLGVNLNGAAKAYLTRMAAYHHILHDQFGRTPVVVTW
jgi:hypothetical protein